MQQEGLFQRFWWWCISNWEHILYVLSTPHRERLLEEAYCGGQSYREANKPCIVPKRYQNPYLAFEWIRGWNNVEADKEAEARGGIEKEYR